LYLDRVVGREDYSRGLKWINKAASHGDATAVHVLGHSYRYGLGVPRHPKKGFALELKAARKGVPEAQFAVGFRLSRGTGVRPDHEQALKWYRKAANRGIADAAYNVGYFYDNGRGTKKDREKAKHWYARAEQLRKERKNTRAPLPPLGGSRSARL
jgi:TPR repeat protein